jgi:hypothetical protein
LLLGKSNKAKKTTKLTTKKGVALALKSKKGPALSVNTTDLIANLNADSVDGKGLDDLEPLTLTTTLGTAGGPGSPSIVASQTTTLPSGTYKFTVHGYIDLGAGDSAECVALDLTRFLPLGTDYSAVYAVGEAVDGSNFVMKDQGIGQVIAGNRLVFFCVVPPTSNYFAPVTFTVQKLDRMAPLTGVAVTTVPKGSGRIGN